MLVRLFPTVFNRGHPKASHFPKWTVLVGKWVVLKRKMGSAENWACPKKFNIYYIVYIQNKLKKLKNLNV